MAKKKDIEKKERTTKQEIISKNNTKKKEVQKQLDIVTQKFLTNPQPFFKEKEKEVAKLIEKYGDLENVDLENGVVSLKDYSLSLSYYISKPFLKFGATTKKYNAETIAMANQFYWEKVVIPINEKMMYVPMLNDLLRMLGISTTTFKNYATNGDEKMRETCEMIKDQFISYYQNKGLQKQISEVMSMFVLKTTYQQRENDTPQVLIQNNTITSDEKIKNFANQYGFDEYIIEDKA